MKNICILLLLCVVVLIPKDTLATTQTSQQKIAQLLELIAQLKQQLSLVQGQQSTATAVQNTATTYDSADIKKITYQEVYSDSRAVIHRYEIVLANDKKIVVSIPKKGKTAEVAKQFKASGFLGTDVKKVMSSAKRVPGLKWQTCEIKSDKKTYAPNEPITLTWSSDAKYVAFNANGSSDKKSYVDESFRDPNGSVTIKVATPGRHYINMNVYPWKERFASGACTVSFEVGGATSKDLDDEQELPDDPTLSYFTVEPSATVKYTDKVNLRYAVEKSSQCGIFAKKGSDTITILAKAMNKSLRVENIGLPEWATPGSSFDFLLRCDSLPNAYYKSQVDALVESISMKVTQ